MKAVMALICCAVACQVMGKEYSASEGWEPLFNGTNLTEFVVEDGKATYTLKDGVITGTTAVPSPNTFLATIKEYGDFELEFETKISDELNSGVQIRSRSRIVAEGRFPAGRFYGPQVEIAATKGKSGYIFAEATGRGWLSPEARPGAPRSGRRDFLKKGEWNHFRIVAKGARIQTYVNGELIVDLTDEEIFKTHPTGHLGFQVHAVSAKMHPMSVSWRNLYIRLL